MEPPALRIQYSPAERRRIVALALGAAMLLVAGAVLGLALLRDTHGQQSLLAQTLKVQAHIEKLRAARRSASRAALDAVAHQSPADVFDLARWRTLVRSRWDEIRQLTSADPMQTRRLDALWPELERHLRLLDGLSALPDRELRPALAQRRELDGQLELAINAINDDEVRRLAVHEAAFTQGLARQGLVVAAITLLGIAFLGTAAAILLRLSRQLAVAWSEARESAAALGRLNGELESRVGRRTEALRLNAAVQKLRYDGSQRLMEGTDSPEDRPTLERWRHCMLDSDFSTEIELRLVGRAVLGSVTTPAAGAPAGRLITLALPHGLGTLAFRRPVGGVEPPTLEVAQSLCDDLGAWLELRRQRDVRLQAERERDERDVLLAALFEQAPIPMLLLDPELNVMRVNAAAAAVSGHDPAKIVGVPLVQLRRRDGPPLLIPLFTEVRQTGRSIINRKVALPLLAHTDAPRDLLVSVLRLQRPDGTCFGLAATALDITELEQARRLMSELARRLLQVAEAERTALARELHDDLGQRLAALKMNLQLQERTGAGPAGRPSLREAILIAESCIEQVRQRAFDLRPAQLDELGLAAALHSHAHDQARLAATPVKCTVALDDLVPGVDWSSHVYRIIQEAVRNALHHGLPTWVEVSLTVAAGEVVLAVSDDGIGIAASTGRVGLGLLNMRERAELVGGRFEVRPMQPRGTRVVCRWPLAAARGEALLHETAI